MVLRRIEPISLAKIYGVLGALYGLLVGLPMACFMSMMGSAMDQYGGGGGMMGGIGIAAVILYPIMGAVFGFIGGLIGAFVYNFAAERVGGVEMEFDEEIAGDIL
jgi:hypothetical protein